MDQQQMEKLSRDYQTVQEQLQTLAVQKGQFSAQKEELKDALAEIEKSAGKIYSAIGGVIVEVSKEEAKGQITEQQSSIEMRLGIIGKQYDDAVKKEQTLRETITSALKGEGRQ
ncbi:MAG: prefoldin subunit [Candidatus Micrarchaeota archaeon]|nr:prefoldin subunit [Candidatus Micrarchaeota archaeon]